MLLVGKLRVCRVVADKRILNNVLRIRSVRADIAQTLNAAEKILSLYFSTTTLVSVFMHDSSF